MLSNNTAPLNALVMTHDAKDLGGVGNYIKIMKQRLRPGTNVHRFINGPRHGETGKLGKLTRMILDYARFLILIMRRRFDVVHFNPEMDLRSFPRESLFMFVLILIGRPFVVFHHGWNWKEFEIITKSPFRRRWLFFVLRKASGVIVLSKAFQDALVKQGVDRDRIEIVTTMFDGRVLKAPADNKPNMEQPKLLFMSRFVKEKGVYELVEAVSLLKDEFPALKLVMGGDGPEMDGLKARVKELGITDQVLFPGYVRGDNKARLFAEATIFMLPSFFWEGLPTAAIEAMGMGLPVIASRVGGLPEVMDDPDNGLFLGKITAEEVADKARFMLRDPAYMEATSKRNQDRAWANYESAVVSRKVEAVYRSACNPNGPLTTEQAA